MNVTEEVDEVENGRSRTCSGASLPAEHHLRDFVDDELSGDEGESATHIRSGTSNASASHGHDFINVEQETDDAHGRGFLRVADEDHEFEGRPSRTHSETSISSCDHGWDFLNDEQKAGEVEVGGPHRRSGTGISAVPHGRGFRDVEQEAGEVVIRESRNRNGTSISAVARGCGFVEQEADGVKVGGSRSRSGTSIPSVVEQEADEVEVGASRSRVRPTDSSTGHDRGFLKVEHEVDVERSRRTSISSSAHGGDLGGVSELLPVRSDSFRSSDGQMLGCSSQLMPLAEGASAVPSEPPVPSVLKSRSRIASMGQVTETQPLHTPSRHSTGVVCSAESGGDVPVQETVSPVLKRRAKTVSSRASTAAQADAPPSSGGTGDVCLSACLLVCLSDTSD